MNKKDNNLYNSHDREEEISFLENVVNFKYRKNESDQKTRTKQHNKKIIFLCGEYGSGKTYVIDKYIKKTQKKPIPIFKNKVDASILSESDLKSTRIFKYLKFAGKMLYIRKNFRTIFWKYFWPATLIYYSIFVPLLFTITFSLDSKLLLGFFPWIIIICEYFLIHLISFIFVVIYSLKKNFFILENINLLSKEKIENNFVSWFHSMWEIHSKLNSIFLIEETCNSTLIPKNLDYYFADKFEYYKITINPNRAHFFSGFQQAIEKVNKILINEERSLKEFLNSNLEKFLESNWKLESIFKILTNRQYERIIQSFELIYKRTKGEVNVFDFIMYDLLATSQRDSVKNFFNEFRYQASNKLNYSKVIEKDVEKLDKLLNEIEKDNYYLFEAIKVRGYTILNKYYRNQKNFDYSMDNSFYFSNYDRQIIQRISVATFLDKILKNPISIFEDTELRYLIYRCDWEELKIDLISNDDAKKIIYEISHNFTISNREDHRLFQRIVGQILSSRRETVEDFIKSEPNDFTRILLSIQYFEWIKLRYTGDKDEYIKTLNDLNVYEKDPKEFSNVPLFASTPLLNNQFSNMVKEIKLFDYREYLIYQCSKNKKVLEFLFFNESRSKNSSIKYYDFIKFSENNVPKKYWKELQEFLNKEDPHIPCILTDGEGAIKKIISFGKFKTKEELLRQFKEATLF